MADFLESPPFPGCPSFGFVADPIFDVTITPTASGRERRNGNWSRPLMQYSATVGPRREDEIQLCRDFFMVVRSTEIGFRFMDYQDYKSCYVSETPTAFDQPMVETDTPGVFQLTRLYDVGGALTQERDVYKPIQGTILVSANGVILTESTHYAIDYTTGLVDFVGTPSAPVKWGGEFHVPARFDSGFPVEILNKKIQSVQFLVRELRAGSE